LKKIILLIAMISMLSAVYASTDAVVTANYGQLKASKMHFIGSGIGIYSSDTEDSTDIAALVTGMKSVKLAVGSFPAQVRQYQDQTLMEARAQPFLIQNVNSVREYVDTRRMGIMKFGDDLYGLKEVVVGTNELSGNVYSSPSTAGELIGVFDLAKKETNATGLVWTGTMTITEEDEEKEIGLYIKMRKQYTVKEIAQKVHAYCLYNQCTGLTQQAGTEETVQEYCETNEDDPKCQEIMVKYCEDQIVTATTAKYNYKCVEYLKNKCATEAYSTKEYCVREQEEGEEETAGIDYSKLPSTALTATG
jgi:hypothetical protein